MVTTTSGAITINKVIKASTIGSLTYGSNVPSQDVYTDTTTHIAITTSGNSTHIITGVGLTINSAVPEEGSWNSETRLWEQTVAPVNGSVQTVYTIPSNGIYRVSVVTELYVDGNTNGNVLTTVGTGVFNKIATINTLTI